MKRGYLYIAVTTLLFSSMEVALKLISGSSTLSSSISAGFSSAGWCSFLSPCAN